MQPSSGTTHEHHQHGHHGQHVMPDGTVMKGAHHEHAAHAHHDHSHHAHAPAAAKPAAKGDQSQVEYTCPMHPQVRQMGPGNCPICGMALEPVLATAEQGESPELRDMTQALLDWHGAHGAGLRAGDGRPPHEPEPPARAAAVELDSAAAGHAGGAVGRLAVLRARGGVGEEPQPEHVLAHRAGHRCGLALQHRRHRGAAAVPGRAAPGGRRGRRSTSRPRRSSRCWCCWARCSSCARARRPPAPSRRCSAWRRRRR